MKRLLTTLGIALSTVLLPGCWLQVGFDAGHTRHNDLEDGLTAENAGTLAEAWSIEVGSTASEPMVRDGRVYVMTGGLSPEGRANARIAVFRTDTGAFAAARDFPDICCPGGLAEYVPASFVGDELWTGYLVFAGGFGGWGVPTRMDPDDLEILDEDVTDAQMGTAAVSAGDHVVQGWIKVFEYRRLVVRDKATLAVQFKGVLPGDQSGGPFRTAPAVADGQAFMADLNVLYGFSLAGCGAAECPPTWTLDLGAPATAVAAVPGGDTVFVTRANDLLAVDRATGTIAWTAPLGAPAPGLAIAHGSVYVGAGTTLATFPVAGCGAASCAPTASETLAAPATAAPAVAGGVVYVGEQDTVEAFAADGSLDRLATLPVTGKAYELSVAAGQVFVVSRPGTDPSRLTAFAPMP